MAANCKICRAPNVADIDRALAQGEIPQREIAELAIAAGVVPPVTQATIHYHKRHAVTYQPRNLRALLVDLQAELIEEMDGKPALEKADHLLAVLKLQKHLPDSSRAPIQTTGGFLYFIRQGTTGLVKIGHSHDPDARLRELQTSNGESLVLLGSRPGTRADEAELHEVYADLRVRGEWFTETPELAQEWGLTAEGTATR